MFGVVTRSGISHGLGALAFAALLCMFGMSSAHALNPQIPFHGYVLDQWSVPQGLPQITVLDMAEDRAGFLWISTQKAVARFDGVQFVAFDRAATGVDTTMLDVVWADPHGQVWFGGAHGLLRQQDGHFTALGGSAVHAIIDAGDGTPLLGTANGVSRVQDGAVVPVAGYSGPAFSLLRDGETLWIGGLGRICKRDGSVAPAAVTCIRQSLPQQPRIVVKRMALVRGSLWLGTQMGLMRVDGESIVPSGVDANVDTESIESLLVDREGALWIGSVQALYRVLPDSRVERVADDDLAPRPWVRALFEDRAGNLWLGTHTLGLYRAWNGWIQRVSARDGVTDPLMWSIVRSPDGQFVLGTNSDVEILAGSSARARVLIPGTALPNPSAYTLYYDRHGRLWVGTRAGLAVYDRGRNVTPAAMSVLGSWRIDDVREVANDDFWIGTSGGLYRWREGELSRVNPGASAAAASIRFILPITPDHLYIGTEDGVREWQAGKLLEPAWAKPLRGHFVSHLAMLKPGVLGIATVDVGIGVMRDGQLRMLGKQDGLPSDNAWTLDVLDGNLYVGSIAGAWRLPLAELPLPGSPARTVSPQMVAGVVRDTGVRPVHCCNGGAAARSLIDGKAIWYSTTDGALRVDTQILGALPVSPAAWVESVEHDGKQFSAGNFELTEGTRDLVFHYTAPWLRVGALGFRYRLEGYDTAWEDAGARRSAFYTHLPPGRYHFRVAAMLAGAAGYGPEAEVVVQVRPYWHERTVVRAAAVLALALLVVLLARLGMRAQRERNAWLEAQVERRTEQLARALERLRVANLALAEESHTDTLTALQNRRYLLARLPELLASRGPLGLLQIDIDFFKEVNDRHGHAVGDSVLREIGQMLAAARRDSDVAVRWGGEEFLLLLREVDAGEVLVIAERLRRDIATREFTDGNGGTVLLTCSIGFSMHPLALRSDKATFDAALELSDRALYDAKHDGRNRCVGLMAIAALAAEVLDKPFAPQVDALIACGQLRWVRPAS
ncbi:MAG: diguanylate cyclase [Rhodanobacter sp.]